MKCISKFFILFSFSIYSQQTSWTYNQPIWHYAYTNVVESGFIRLEDTGDTLLQGKVCMKLSATKYSFFITGPTGGLFETHSPYISGIVYQSNDTLFHWNSDHFNVLYIFNPVVNQQWVIFDNIPFFNCNDSSLVQVTASGTEPLNNILFDYYQLSTLQGSGVGIDTKVYNTIGPLGGYFFPTTRNCDSTIIPEFDQIHFICFEDDSLNINPLNETCEWHLGVEELSSAITICYPNPTKDVLFIESESILKECLLIDLLGNIVMRFDLSSLKSSIDLSSLKNGIYFLQTTPIQKKVILIQKTN